MKNGNVMKKQGLALALILSFSSAAFIGCGGSTPKKSTKTAASVEEGGSDNGGGLEGGEAEPSKPKNADAYVPQIKKREISDDAKTDFEKAVKRYEQARKAGTLKDDCDSLAAAFGGAADENPGLVEARFNQGAVYQECGKEGDALRVWEKMPKYGPAIANLGYIAYRKGDTAEAESLFNKAIEVDPLHTIEARNNLAQLLRDKARKASSDSEKKQYVGQAVTHLRTVLALDSDNLQAFATLAFLYYDLGLLEMSKLVGNQAIKKAEEIATGKFEEEKGEAAAEGGKKPKKGKKKGAEGGGEADDKLAKEDNVQEQGTGVTQSMKENLALVHNTLGLVELKRKKISPAISQFRAAVENNPKLVEARMNLAALSLNNRDYKTAEDNFRAVLQLQPKNYEASIGLGVALRGNKKIDEAEAQYNAAQQLDGRNPESYFNLGLLYQDYKGGDKPALQKAQGYYRDFLGKATSNTSESLKKEAEKRIKDIDETFVALEEAAKLQAEAEEMQRKAEEQQKKMEEEMKKQEEAGKAGGAASGEAAPAAAGGDAAKADAAAAPAEAAPAAGGKKKGKKKH